jgi:hypothetical protein
LSSSSIPAVLIGRSSSSPVRALAGGCGLLLVVVIFPVRALASGCGLLLVVVFAVHALAGGCGLLLLVVFPEE